jgi:hypothetical protein
MRQTRTVIGATTIDPKLLTATERLQYDGYLRREETNATILALSKSARGRRQVAADAPDQLKVALDDIGGDEVGKVSFELTVSIVVVAFGRSLP